ncbi:hypothetical protein JB92DRAFT_3102756 [Gautieria morchelliformis]|nr:hypothetical protein JB92DRAFT_3102756 [Gautieria morchelliformis]
MSSLEVPKTLERRSTSVSELEVCKCPTQTRPPRQSALIVLPRDVGSFMATDTIGTSASSLGVLLFGIYEIKRLRRIADAGTVQAWDRCIHTSRRRYADRLTEGACLSADTSRGPPDSLHGLIMAQPRDGMVSKLAAALDEKWSAPTYRAFLLQISQSFLAIKDAPSGISSPRWCLDTHRFGEWSIQEMECNQLETVVIQN